MSDFKSQLRQNPHLIFSREKISKSLATFIVNEQLKGNDYMFFNQFIQKYEIPKNLIRRILCVYGDLIHYVKDPTLEHWQVALHGVVTKANITRQIFESQDLSFQLAMLEADGTLFFFKDQDGVLINKNNPRYYLYAEAAYKSEFSVFHYFNDSLQFKYVNNYIRVKPKKLKTIKKEIRYSIKIDIPFIVEMLFRLKGENHKSYFRLFSREQQTDIFYLSPKLYPYLNKLGNEERFQNHYFDYVMRT